MYICFAYTYTLILLLIGYSGCSDKPTDTQGSNSNEDNLPQIGGLSLVDYSDSEEEDNFQVTETQETHEGIRETDVLDETRTEQITETTQVLTETTQAEPIKDVETQTDLQQPEPQTEPEPDDNQIKEKLHVLYYVPPPQEPYGIYQQIVAIPPIKPLPPPVPGESPKYYLISAEQNKYGEHETIPVTYMEYKPILQPVLYYEPIIGPDSYPPVQYPSVSYPVVIPPPIQPRQQSTITKESPQQPSRIPRRRTNPKEHKPSHPNIRRPIKILRRPTQPEQSKEPTKEPTQEPQLIRRPIKILRRPTEESTHDESKDSTHTPTKEPTQSTEESTHDESKEPTHTPTKEPTQSTEEYKEPTEGLEAETISVEVGSDEDEPTEPQRGPGDGDQPPDKPEEGTGEGGDEDEEEDEEGKKRDQSVKICEVIRFFKKNEEGDLVEMSWGDYEIKYDIQYETRYEFLANLEELHCDDEIIFTHIIGDKYCKVLVYNEKNTSFLIILENSYVLVSCVNRIFKTSLRRIVDCLKIYTIDSIGNEVKISEKDYKLRITKSKWFMIKFNNGIKCHKIVFKNMLVWEKTNYDNDPIALTINVNLNVVVIFKQYSKTFVKRGRKYVLQYVKTYKTN